MRKRFFAGFAASVLAAGIMAAVPMSAGAEASRAVDTNKFEFDKYLIMDSDAAVPGLSFTYTIAPGTAVAANNIKAGPEGAKFTDGAATKTITFSSSDTVIQDTDDYDTESKVIDFDNEHGNEKAAVKALEIDFSEVDFPDPGIYRYVLTETTTTDAAITYDAAPAKYLDVIVTADETTHDPVIASKILHYTKVTDKGEEDVKVTGFNNKFNTNDLAFEKAVSGNQASKNKYFKFNVKLTAADGAYEPADDYTFVVSGSHSHELEADDATYKKEVINAANNFTTLTYAQLKEGKDVYLKAGQKLIIEDLPRGISYLITEINEDYTPTIAVDRGDNEGFTADVNAATATDTSLTANTTVKFTNNKDGAIPTGVIVAVAVPAALSLVGFIGVVTILIKRRKDNTEG